MEKQWILLKKGADFEKIGKTFGISPVLARLLRNRELLDEEEIQKFLYGDLDALHAPSLMKNMTAGAALIKKKIEEKKSIRIVGDYDIDGVMSSYILHSGLLKLGACVDVKIPHRMKDGYGLNQGIIDECREDGIDTILTCDNGIAAMEEIRLAKEYGMTVVVTDHHEIPYEEKENEEGIKVRNCLLPPADYIINPKQEDCPYPFSGICGAVVAYKFIEELLSLYGRAEEAIEYVQYAAFATIGDIMELKDENRILVKHGLKMLENTRNPGLRALMQKQELLGKPLSPYHIGFMLGPCINASGRLDTAKAALCLLEGTEEEAWELASKLHSMNEARKTLTKEAVEEAEAQIEKLNLNEKNNVLVVYLENCHESLAGIVAGRIKEKYYKPVIVLTKSEEGIKGSGRSIPAYSMFEELSKCRELFSKFGGHPMAAGMTLTGEDYQELSRKLNEKETLTPEDLRERVMLDMELPFHLIDEALVEELRLLEPYGQGNPRPLFACRNVRVRSKRTMGASGRYMKMQLEDAFGTIMEAVVFKNAQPLAAPEVEALTIAYYPDINEFRGKRSIQIILEEYLVIAKK